MFFGIAGASLGEKFNAPLVAALDVVSHIMLAPAATGQRKGHACWACGS
jgi:hypothetical protein